MSTSSQVLDWETSLYDSGDGGDCPRSCFIGCDQFSRTRHRLDQLHRGDDPMDLSKRNGCNTSCWNYGLLCTTLYIGSGVYTGKQTRRIRETYGIKGSYGDDLAKGIFCQPCSLIRNDLEVRRREQGNAGHELSDMRPPMPLGEENYRPIYAMSTAEGYRPEPQMATPNLRHVGSLHAREVHFHPSLDEPGAQSESSGRVVPLYPTEQERQEHEQNWKGGDTLPQIPQVSSPLSAEGLERRAQILTPISEGDSLEDNRIQQRKENIPKASQVQTWLQSMKPAETKTKHGETSPEPCPDPHKKRPKKSGSPKKSPKRGNKGKLPDVPRKELPAKEASEQPSTTPSPDQQQENSGVPTIKNARAIRPEHGLSTDIRVPSPSESQRIHSLQGDIVVPNSSPGPHVHNIQDDVPAPSESPRYERPHNLHFDPRVSIPDDMPPEHRISADKQVKLPPFDNREHSLSKDRFMSMDTEGFHEHGLDDDEFVRMEDDKEDSEPEPEGHALPADQQVLVSISPVKAHDLDSDSRVSTPKPAHLREHSIGSDICVPTPRGPMPHGITLDERVPTPEFMRRNLEHNIQQDRRVMTPSPGYEEHDLHADGRVKSPAILPPRHHSIRSDKRVASPLGRLREHSIRSDKATASPSQGQVKDHSISTDSMVGQRAYQLLEHFLEQDRKASNRSSKG